MKPDKWTWRKVFKYLDFYDQHNFIAICGFLNDNVFVTDLYNIPDEIKNRLSDEMIQYYPYCKKLDCSIGVSHKQRIYAEVREMRREGRIREFMYLLDNKVSLLCKITSKNLPRYLKVLDVSGNCDIIDISHLPLKKLNASGETCSIYTKYLPLSLKELDVSNNFLVKNIAHLINLKYLVAKGNCSIKNEYIPLTVTSLVVDRNPMITNVSHLQLYSLSAGGSSGITNEGFPDTLEMLSVDDNPNITDVSHLRLWFLSANYESGISDENLPDSLVMLFADFNSRIRDVGYLPLLEDFDQIPALIEVNE